MTVIKKKHIQHVYIVFTKYTALGKASFLDTNLA